MWLGGVVGLFIRVAALYRSCGGLLKPFKLNQLLKPFYRIQGVHGRMRNGLQENKSHYFVPLKHWIFCSFPYTVQSEPPGLATLGCGPATQTRARTHTHPTKTATKHKGCVTTYNVVSVWLWDQTLNELFCLSSKKVSFSWGGPLNSMDKNVI